MNQKFLDTTTHNIAWFVKRADADELELSPPFQRNPVWSVAHKSFLIDTILRGYPIPELYIQEFTSENGDEEYVVVDGQQRLRACIEFVNNEFALKSTKEQEVLFEGDFFDDLDGVQRKNIYNYSFVVRKLPEMSHEELRGIFARLNRNTVVLNPQELRNSIFWGAFIKSMEQIGTWEVWSRIGVFTPNDVRRMLDIEFISELAVAMLAGQQNKKDELDDWYAANEENFEDQEDIEKSFKIILKEITNSLPDIALTRWSKKSDFYTLFYWMHENLDKFPLKKKGRKEFGEKLRNFADLVDAYIANPDIRPAPPASVRRYGVAVSKAASDLGNRRTRFIEFSKFMDA